MKKGALPRVHTISLDEIASEHFDTTLAGGDAQSGHHKSLMLRCAVGGRLTFAVTHGGRDHSEYGTLAEAVEAYNEL